MKDWHGVMGHIAVIQEQIAEIRVVHVFAIFLLKTVIMKFFLKTMLTASFETITTCIMIWKLFVL